MAKGKGAKQGRQLKRGVKLAQQRRARQIDALQEALATAHAADIEPSAAEEQYFMINYDVTAEPVNDGNIESLTAADRERFEEASGLVDEDPELAVSILKDLTRRYPEVADVANNLLAAQGSLGSVRDLGRLLRQNYETWPNYLFARINYANYLISEGRHDEVPALIDHKFKLNELYPERQVFHHSEHISFLAMVGMYFAVQGRFTMGMRALELLEPYEGDHPAIEALDEILSQNPIAVAMDLYDELGDAVDEDGDDDHGADADRADSARLAAADIPAESSER